MTASISRLMASRATCARGRWRVKGVSSKGRHGMCCPPLSAADSHLFGVARGIRGVDRADRAPGADFVDGGGASPTVGAVPRAGLHTYSPRTKLGIFEMGSFLKKKFCFFSMTAPCERF